MALGHVGRPALPGLVEGFELLERAHQVRPRQQLRPPGGLARTHVEEGDVRLTAVERVVERGQVGDLEGDHDEAGGGGEEVDPEAGTAAGYGESERQEGGS